MKVPTYWFCFLVAFGLVALMPFWQLRIGRRNVQSTIILANAYRGMWDLPWKPTLIGHIAVATTIASVVTVILHCRSAKHQVAHSFGLRTLMMLTVVCAFIAAGLRLVDVHPLVLGCAIVPIIAYPLTCLVAVKLRRYDVLA